VGGSTPGEAVAWARVGTTDGVGEMMGEGGNLWVLELAVTVEGEGGVVRAARALSPKPHFSYLDLCCLDARTVICFPYLF
jgi:hypothetical protein